MKQKWYRTNIAKAVLLVAAHAAVAVIMACILWVAAYPALRLQIFEKDAAKEYKDSMGFSELMRVWSEQAAYGVRIKELFETEGNYDENKLIDVMSYYNTRKTDAEEAGEISISYRLKDLAEWYKNLDDSEESAQDIIVCKRADGTFYYYYMSEFYQLIKESELRFIVADLEDTEYTEQEILSDLENGYELSHTAFRGIQDAEGKMVYSDCWKYDGVISEKYAPMEAGSILDFVNEEPEWNGRLSELYDMIRSVIWDVGSQYESYENLDNGQFQEFQEGNTNFSYIYADMKSGRVYTNRKEYENYAELQKNLEKIKQAGRYAVVAPKLADFESNMDVEASVWRDCIISSGIGDEDFIFASAVDTSYPIQDTFYTENQLFEKYGSGGGPVLLGLAAAIVVFVISVLWLVVIAGRRSGDGELHLNWFDRWKTEIAAAIVIAGWLIPIYAFFKMDMNWGAAYRATKYGESIVTYSSYVTNSLPYIILYSGAAVFTCAMFLIGLLSLVRRIKGRVLWKNSLLKSVCCFTGTIVRNLSTVWKTILVFAAAGVFELFVLLSCGWLKGFPLFLLLLVNIAAFVYFIYGAIGKDRIKKGVEKIAGGEVDYKIPLDGLRGTQKDIAGKINSIGEGLDTALEESMKSERLKTDLITNVSHDIKTPLTSIINYVDLLKQENFEDPKIRRYIEVLEAKAQRLKNLTEDVVEASKVSSGNITLEYMNINLVEMIQQTSGEFEEKFKARNLHEVLSLPDTEAVVRVDGRRTWRILENIYNNAAKYAMEGTRVYADLEVQEHEIVFSLKNISEQPLNISADELTERFIRGDISRSTEGSGLGLSIAQSLAEMQGGKFKIYLDGDLFKVTVAFPKQSGTE